jgi:hypothetical protein
MNDGSLISGVFQKLSFYYHAQPGSGAHPASFVHESQLNSFGSLFYDAFSITTLYRVKYKAKSE